MKTRQKIKDKLLEKHGAIAYLELAKFLGIVIVIYTVVVFACYVISKYAGLF